MNTACTAAATTPISVCRPGRRGGRRHRTSALLMHHQPERGAISGPSYRLKNRLKAIERETEVA